MKKITDKKREDDRRRMRGKRLLEGARPQELSNESLKPWAVEGVSRSTWYRRLSRFYKQPDITMIGL